MGGSLQFPQNQASELIQNPKIVGETSTHADFPAPANWYASKESEQVRMQGTNDASVNFDAGGSIFSNAHLNIDPEAFTHWAPYARHGMSAKSSRANSFSAASALSYVTRKDLDAFTVSKEPEALVTEASEVNFSTPQAYESDEELAFDIGGVQFSHFDMVSSAAARNHRDNSDTQSLDLAPPALARPSGNCINPQMLSGSYSMSVSETFPSSSENNSVSQQFGSFSIVDQSTDFSAGTGSSYIDSPMLQGLPAISSNNYVPPYHQNPTTEYSPTSQFTLLNNSVSPLSGGDARGGLVNLGKRVEDDLVKKFMNIEEESTEEGRKINDGSKQQGWTTSLNEHSLNMNVRVSHAMSTDSNLRKYILVFLREFNSNCSFIHEATDLFGQNMILAMSMAVIGAMYEGDREASEKLYSLCCESIHNFLNVNGRQLGEPDAPVPIWLLRAMCLCIFFGLHQNDYNGINVALKLAGELSRLVKIAKLIVRHIDIFDVNTASLQEKWLHFVEVNKRIRTVCVIHGLSAMMASCFNLKPIVQNQDLLLGLPCDESLWVAKTAEEWWNIVQQKGLENSFLENMDFNLCFSNLISGQPIMQRVPQSVLQTLIYAIHLKIVAECVGATEQRNKQANEALIRAWENTWSMSPLASMESNSKYGPIMSSCIPIASLAYLHSSINLIVLKSYVISRDHVRMNAELDRLGREQRLDMLDSANYSLDSIAWCLKQPKTPRIFVYVLWSLLDCAFVLSETLRYVESMRDGLRNELERALVVRSRKVLTTVPGILTDSSLARMAITAVLTIFQKAVPWPSLTIIKEALESRLLHIQIE